MNYNSRIDAYTWLNLFLSVAVFALPNFVFNFSWVYFGIMLLADIWVITSVFTTRYVLEENEVVVKSGFFKFGISYDRIVQINKKNSLFSASSHTAIKCIELKFGDDKYNTRSVKISPEREEDFLTKLVLRCNDSVEIKDLRK